MTDIKIGSIVLTPTQLDELKVPKEIQNDEAKVKEYLKDVDLSKIDKSNGNDSFESTTKTSNTKNGSQKSSAEIQAEIDKLKNQEKKNKKDIKNIEKNIDKLVKQAADRAIEASRKQEEEANSQDIKAKRVIREELAKYVAANENGTGMTKEELNSNIQSAMPGYPNMSNALKALSDANSLVGDIDDSVSDIKSLVQKTEDIQNQIIDKTAEFRIAKDREDDPIGFNFENETYEFIVDDGAFDSTSDFLGAKDQWAAMEKLNTNGDDVVSKEELQAGNIKVVNSKGEVSDLSKFDDISINLASYEQGGTFEGLDTDNQKLLGTFGLNVNGQQVNGYNSLDNQDWLSKKYGISKSAQGAEGLQTGLTLDTTLKAALDKADTTSNLTSNLRQEYADKAENIGQSVQNILNTKEIQKQGAMSQAENFFMKFTKSQEQEEDNDSIKDSDLKGNQWQAIGQLDTDGDKRLTKQELEIANIKIVNSNGEISDLSNFNDLPINLTSFNHSSNIFMELTNGNKEDNEEEKDKEFFAV